MENSPEIFYLQSLLGRTLRVHTTDTRMFVGTFKCTDADRNIILASTYEYRFPSSSAIQAAAESNSIADIDKVNVDMTSRLIGLVVVPGQHITRIELEGNPHELQVPPKEGIGA